MKPAVKTALAYAHITGRLPKHIHISTWGEAYRCLVYGCGSLNSRVKEEFLSEIEDHPFVIGHAKMLERGFRLIPYQRNTSHSIGYRSTEDDSEGYITRTGKGCWIWDRSEKAVQRLYKTEYFDVV